MIIGNQDQGAVAKCGGRECEMDGNYIGVPNSPPVALDRSDRTFVGHFVR